jgi:hypothetical protein
MNYGVIHFGFTELAFTYVRGSDADVDTWPATAVIINRMRAFSAFTSARIFGHGQFGSVRYRVKASIA